MITGKLELESENVRENGFYLYASSVKNSD
jgi:hypothetical protein